VTGTAEAHAHTLVLATDYRVPDPSRVWPLLQKRRDALADLGAHHVLVYTSTRDPGRVLVTMGLRTPDRVLQVLRSRVFMDWFDAVGVDDIPAVFAGETVDNVAFTATDAATDPARPPGVIIAVIASVADVPRLIARVHDAADRFAAAGIRSLRIFRAFDDDREVMILQELDSEADARRWIDHPDVAAEWMAGAGVGAYPPVFVGRFRHMMRIDEKL
jgi:heme-degrading monooxygenase HmoA